MLRNTMNLNSVAPANTALYCGLVTDVDSAVAFLPEHSIQRIPAHEPRTGKPRPTEPGDSHQPTEYSHSASFRPASASRVCLKPKTQVLKPGTRGFGGRSRVAGRTGTTTGRMPSMTRIDMRSCWQQADQAAVLQPAGGRQAMVQSHGILSVR